MIRSLALPQWVLEPSDTGNEDRSDKENMPRITSSPPLFSDKSNNRLPSLHYIRKSRRNREPDRCPTLITLLRVVTFWNPFRGRHGLLAFTDREMLDLFVASRDEAAFHGPGRAARADGAAGLRGGPRKPPRCPGCIPGHVSGAGPARRLDLPPRLARELVVWRGFASLWLASRSLIGSPAQARAKNGAALHAERFSREETAREPFGPLLHAELGRLPERFRAPVVLCYLEGRTHEEAKPGSWAARWERSRAGWPRPACG